MDLNMEELDLLTNFQVIDLFNALKKSIVLNFI
jgi:hypothetical protein